MTDKQINVKVTIADRPYRLKIDAQNETRVRKAAKKIQEKIAELQNIYKASDRQDYLAMTALLMCINLLEKEEQGTQGDEQLHHSIDEIEAILNQFLGSKKMNNKVNRTIKNEDSDSKNTFTIKH